MVRFISFLLWPPGSNRPRRPQSWYVFACEAGRVSCSKRILERWMQSTSEDRYWWHCLHLCICSHFHAPDFFVGSLRQQALARARDAIPTAYAAGEHVLHPRVSSIPDTLLVTGFAFSEVVLKATARVPARFLRGDLERDSGTLFCIFVHACLGASLGARDYWSSTLIICECLDWLDSSLNISFLGLP